MTSVDDGVRVAALGELSEFREEVYRSLCRRPDALFELCDAVLCLDGPVTSLVGLSLVAEHRRGHGALYDAMNAGRIEIDRLRRALVGVALPRDGVGRIVLAVDVSAWLRPAAWTSPDRLFCHVSSRGFGGSSQQVAGWSYSFVAALEPGRSSWTAVLDVVRLRPADDPTEVTAAQVREVVGRLGEAGRWSVGDPRILLVFDAGYDLTRLAWLLRDLPVDLVGRLRSDRVMYLPAPPRPGVSGRPRRHGDALDLDKPDRHPQPSTTTVNQTSQHGTAVADAWDRVHPKLVRRHAWAEHPGTLPIVEGTVILSSPGFDGELVIWFSGVR